MLKALILTTSALFTLPVWATNQQWNCTAIVRLHGSIDHYYTWGRDAWNGSARLNCVRGGKRVSRQIYVSFNSSQVGYGADEGSTLKMHLSLTTNVHPRELQVVRPVTDRAQGGEVRWRFSSRLSNGTARVQFREDQALNSLSSGSFYLRSAP
jgi:hypothetical protein